MPLLLAAFTITRPVPLPPSSSALQPAFDTPSATRLARELDALYPDRSPGSPSAPAAARWVQQHFAALGLTTQVERFTASIPGRGRTQLRNILAVVPGRSLDTIVVVAHRDTTAGRPGLVDNASGTGTLVELATAYGAARTGGTAGVSPNHTLVFASTDAGAYGLLGARELVRSPRAGRTVALISLDGIGAGGHPRVHIAGRGPRSPSPRLLVTALARLAEQGGPGPRTASALGQLVDLGFPLSLTEQLEALGAGVPSLAITSDGTPRHGALGEQLDARALGSIGRATEALVASLDGSLAPPERTAVILQFRDRTVQGWALGLVYAALFVPFAVALLDLLIRLRRRSVALRPAFRSYGRRLAFWLAVGAVFLLFGLAGAWPDGDASALNPSSQAAGHWPRLAIALFGLVVAVCWLVARMRLLPRRPVTHEDDVAGIVAALTALACLGLVTIATNIYALLFLLPSVHAWLFLVQTRDRRAWARVALFAGGLAGPALLLASLATRFGLGLDAPWYLAELAAIGYVPTVSFVLALAWAAAAAQVLVASSGRYAPYPSPRDRPPNLVALAVQALRTRRGSRGRPAAPPGSEIL